MSEFFQKAKPIWIKGMSEEKNIYADFRSIISTKSKDVQIKIATSCIYNLYVNNKFVCYGPARAGRGHFRVDEIDIGDFCESELENCIVIEAIGYYVNSYCLIKQQSFLQAEICESGKVVAYTSDNHPDINSTFIAQYNKNYIRKTQRYSFQRPMLEAYKLDMTWDDFRKGISQADETQKLELQPAQILISRRADYPIYEHCIAKPIFSGNAEKQNGDMLSVKDRSLVQIDEKLQGFPFEELEFSISEEAQALKFTIATEPNLSQKLKDGEFQIYEFPFNATGKIAVKITCSESIKLYCIFDEVLTNGDVSCVRMGCANTIRYELEAGCYDLKTAEVYTLKYLKLVAFGGSFEIDSPTIIEYKHPPVSYLPKVIKGDAELTKIFEAAVESYRQNSVDLFMDCPSRERAGWLCDSFFTARVERVLTGESKIEKSFLENFLHEDSYETLPKGMLPMCYPADHIDGNYIANWALWIILEIEEYQKRTNDLELVNDFKDKLYGLLEYFVKYENSDGLLEGVGGWVFIEWSKANDLVQDVNYPSNMLYSAALRCMASLYDDEKLTTKADKIKQTILKQSYKNGFFTDNAVRENGILKNTGESTEVCQYYAFFFDIATKQSHPQLFETLIKDFGPQRTTNNNLYPDIYPANSFIGNYLRLDIMMRYGYKDEVLQNIRGYFLHMAEKTGTLWENSSDAASCNHGFASHVICWFSQYDEL